MVIILVPKFTHLELVLFVLFIWTCYTFHVNLPLPQAAMGRINTRDTWCKLDQCLLRNDGDWWRHQLGNVTIWQSLFNFTILEVETVGFTHNKEIWCLRVGYVPWESQNLRNTQCSFLKKSWHLLINRVTGIR